VFLDAGNGHRHCVRQATLLATGQSAQPGKIAQAVTSRSEFLFEPSMLRTLHKPGRRGAHGAPVENAEEEVSMEGERKANIIFALDSPASAIPATCFSQGKSGRQFWVLLIPKDVAEFVLPTDENMSAEVFFRSGKEKAVSNYSGRKGHLPMSIRRQGVTERYPVVKRVDPFLMHSGVHHKLSASVYNGHPPFGNAAHFVRPAK
jgi:hypothetical protein